MEVDEQAIALRVTEPLLAARMERILRQVVSEFKGGRLSQDEVTKLKAEYDAARGLLGVLNQQNGGRENG